MPEDGSDQPVPPVAAAAPGTDSEQGGDAVRAALNRARSAARARGLAPGRPGPAAGRLAVSGTGAAARRRLAGQRRSGSGPDERDPQLIGGSIGRLVAERGWDTPVAVGGVMGRWDQVVGAEVAAHCAPESFTDGVLVVRTDSTAWATQMRLLGPTVLARLATELGAGVVRRLVVRGPTAPSWKRGLRSVQGGRGPRDTYG